MAMKTYLLWGLLLIGGTSACLPGEKTLETGSDDTNDSSVDLDDVDGDGYVAGADCDDENAEIHPGMDESCNGFDDNCNGVVDEGFGDVDEDGTPDCMDEEECDGLDNDGDGEIDEDFGDADGDGTADCLDGEDCDGLDNNGDGNIDEGYDADGDGYTSCGSESIAPDCDDTDAAINPGATEVDGNGVDEDCDLLVDEGIWQVGDLVITELLVNPGHVSDPKGEWVELYNASGATLILNGVQLVSGTEVYALDAEDLISLDAESVYVVGASTLTQENGRAPVDHAWSSIQLGNETDSIAVHVEGVVIDQVSWDDGATMPDPSGASLHLDPWYFNAADNDLPASWCLGFDAWAVGTDSGSPGVVNGYCPEFDRDLDGYNPGTGDCDEDDASVHPGATETWYDGVDQNCDGLDDYDADLDGEGSDAHGGVDCNDADAAIHTGATEVCDSVDNDCDGTVDGATATDALTWFPDVDGDSYGDPNSGVVSCSAPSGYIATGQDCDESDATINPGAAEDCNDGIDHDCNGFATCSSCGDGVLDPDEEYEPPPGPFTNLLVDSQTCRWDFSNVSQLYCNGSCTWAGGSGCDQADADLFCQLIMDNENSTATSYSTPTALPEPGIPCHQTSYGTTVSGVDRGVGVTVTWQDSSILANHGPGTVITNPVCTNP